MDTTKSVIKLRVNNPQWTLRQIGEEIGVTREEGAITRERVRQILAKAGLPTRHQRRLNTCKGCGLLTTNKCYCSLLCRHKSARITLVCDQCGGQFERLKSQVRAHLDYKHIFCDKPCQGRRLGLHRGFGSHGGQGSAGAPRKYDYEAVWAVHQEKGWGRIKLSRLLGIPPGSVRKILTTMRKVESDDSLGPVPALRG